MELEVVDSTASAVVVLLDDTARVLTKTTAGSILAAESSLSPAYNVNSTAGQEAFTPIIVNNPDGTLTTLPSCLQSLVGSTRTLLLDSRTYYHHGAYEIFNCKALLPAMTCNNQFGRPLLHRGVTRIRAKLHETLPRHSPLYPESDPEDTTEGSSHERYTFILLSLVAFSVYTFMCCRTEQQVGGGIADTMAMD